MLLDIMQFDVRGSVHHRIIHKKTRIILLLTRIKSFHVYVLERYNIYMVRCDAQNE